MSPRRNRNRRHGGGGGAFVVLAVVVAASVLVLHAYNGMFPAIVVGIAAGFLAGLVLGAGGVISAFRPRLALRVSTRGTRARDLRRELQDTGNSRGRRRAG